jgi:hypothetical protein
MVTSKSCSVGLAISIVEDLKEELTVTIVSSLIGFFCFLAEKRTMEKAI